MGHGRRCQAESTGRQRSVCSTCRSSARPARYISQKEAYDLGIQLPGVRKIRADLRDKGAIGDRHNDNPLWQLLGAKRTFDQVAMGYARSN